MTERNRDYLKQEFKDGERPSGTDFADLIDSFVNKTADGVAVDGDGNLILSRGLRLGDSAATLAGGLRFNGGQVQFHNGAAWVGLASGSSGAFQPVGAGNAVFHNGSVGIGAFTAAAPPTYRLEVTLGANTGTAEQVRLGNAVCSRGGPGNTAFACFSHFSHASDAAFALRQDSSGEVHLNAPLNQRVSIRQNGDQVRLAVTASGQVVINNSNAIGGSAAPFQVNGDAAKTTGANWTVVSDARLKDNVRDLEAGLAQLQRVRPIRFRYNGKAGTPAGLEGVGVLGQEIEQIFPEMIQRIPGRPGDGAELEDLRIYNSSALTYVLVNAVKELAGKVEQLEQALAEIRAAQAASGNPG